MLLYVSLALALAAAADPGGATAARRAADWRVDIDTLVARVTRVHPRPWAHVTREVWMREASALRGAAAKRSDGEMLAGLMHLTAGLQDGHTYVADLGPAGGAWYPLLFYLLADGLWITAADSAHVSLAGARVIRLDATPAAEAVTRIESLTSGDNEFGRREGAAFLANAVLLRALGITKSDSSLSLETDRGTVTLRRVVNGKGDVSWPQYGETGGPPGFALITAFGGRTAATLRDPAANRDLPLHLRGRRAYWWTALPSDSTIYFAFNNVVAQSAFAPRSLREELRAALAHVDSMPSATTRFVLDMRYNSGGDGTLTPMIVNQFVKRDSSIGRAGRFFVITGRKTFSAAAGTVIDLLRHTSAILVGEPMGAPWNACGDAGHSTLPRHHVEVSISTECTWTSSLDSIRAIPVQIPAPMSGADYFAGRDPAIETILSGPAPYPTVDRTLDEQGAAAARRVGGTERAMGSDRVVATFHLGAAQRSVLSPARRKSSGRCPGRLHAQHPALSR